MIASLWFAVCCLLLTAASGQTSPSKSQTQLDKIRTVDLVFTEDTASPPGPTSGGTLDYPMQCTPDGELFLSMRMPPDYLQVRVLSMGGNGSREYSAERITDLYDVQLRKYFAADTGVVLLVNATPENRKGKLTGRFPGGETIEKTAYIGERHNYLARFDREGKYKGSIQIDDSFSAVSQVGVFDSGTLLVLGIERSQRTNRLALLNADGSVLRVLEISKAFSRCSDSLRKSVGAPEGMTVLLPVQFVRFRQSLILVSTSAGSCKVPLLEVKESGEIGTLRITGLPSDHSLESFIPSNDDRWYVRLRTTSTEEDIPGRPVPYNVEVYEADPTTGKVTTHYRVPDNVGEGMIACVHDGHFVAFRRNDAGKSMRMIGVPKPQAKATDNSNP